MEEFETKLAKIHIADQKKQTTYVYPLAEQAPNGTSELYIIAELPLLNPTAEESAEQICLAIASTLRRNYRKASDANSFENAITAINEELGKLVQVGQAEWVDKLNCIIGVKDGSSFFISTTGKISAFLYRDYEFTDISCSAPAVHPLKTFDSVAVGKIKLGDIIILSTAQLFNYLAMDRMRSILDGTDFLVAIQTIIEILKENAGPEIAFASIFNEQVVPGEAPEEQIELENYSVIPQNRESIFSKITKSIKSLMMASSQEKRKPSTTLPKIGNNDRFSAIKQSLRNISNKRPSGEQLAKLGKNVGAGVTGAFHYSKGKLDIDNFQNFSKLKKFVFAALIILLIAVITNIILIRHLNKVKLAQQKSTKDLGSIQTLLNEAQSYLLYKNDSDAQSSLKKATEKMPARTDIPNSQFEQWDTLHAQINSLKDKLEKISHPQVTTLGNLGSGNTLIKLPQYIATQSGNTIVAYNKQSGQFEDGTLLSSQKTLLSVYISGTEAAVFNGTELLAWDYQNKQFSPPFSQSVPDQNSIAGLQFYSTNSRVYTVNKNTKQIISFAFSKNGLSKPVITVSNDDRLSTAQDLAIDGSIYVLNHDGIAKYQSGKPAVFQFPALSTPFSGTGKVFTDKNFGNVYVLDAGNNRIIITDKKGGLVNVLEAQEFTDLKDFVVDEAGKTIHVLNGNTLLKINF
jgi:hypothetical protein